MWQGGRGEIHKLCAASFMAATNAAKLCCDEAVQILIQNRRIYRAIKMYAMPFVMPAVKWSTQLKGRHQRSKAAAFVQCMCNIGRAGRLVVTDFTCFFGLFRRRSQLLQPTQETRKENNRLLDGHRIAAG